MPPIEPRMSAVSRQQRAQQSNPYEGRWRYWYSDIADWMIRNPGGRLIDCAVELNRHTNTISMIVNTNLFQDYLAKRRALWIEEHDAQLRAGMTDVASKGLDLLMQVMKSKGPQIPMQQLIETTNSALDRLGYSPNKQSGPTVVVNHNVGDNRTVIVPGLTAQALEEARMALRQSEEAKRGSSFLASPVLTAEVLEVSSPAANGEEVEHVDEAATIDDLLA